MDKLTASDQMKIVAYNVYAPRGTDALQQKYSLERSDAKKLRLKSEPRSTKCFNKIKSKIKLDAEANDYAVETTHINTGSHAKLNNQKFSSSMMNTYNSSTAVETNATCS